MCSTCDDAYFAGVSAISPASRHDRFFIFLSFDVLRLFYFVFSIIP